MSARIRHEGDEGDSAIRAPRRRSRRSRSGARRSAFRRRADEAMIEGCLKAAAELHHVPAGVLVLLLSVEAGPTGAVSQNSNGTVDIGPMQVNDTWLPKDRRALGARRARRPIGRCSDSFCANVEGGAWILRQALDEARGDLWEGVALYHSHSPDS